MSEQSAGNDTCTEWCRHDLTRVLPAENVAGCSWCPPGCKSCAWDRDCECYTHQDEPDRHADPRYPTKWKRTTMRGCHPGCQAMHVPVESRITGPTTMETRHTDSHEPCPPPNVLDAPTRSLPPGESPDSL